MSDPKSPPAKPSRNLPALAPRPGEGARGAGETWLARALRVLFGWRLGSIRDDLEVVLDESVPGETGFSPEERTMLRNILGLRGRRIADIMVPRGDIVAVRGDIALGELMKVFERGGHSRLVVYNETLDDPEGMVHIRDLISYMAGRATVDEAVNAKRKKPFPAGLDLRQVNLATTLAEARIARKLLYVPPSMPALDLLAKMQATRIHLALVVDEYGGTDGLVSIENLVEEIVGEIDDEHDSDEPPAVVAQPDGSFIADARASLEDVTAVVGEDFQTGDAAEDVNTLGGYLVAQVGRLPIRGEIISGPGRFEIEVLDADPRRVKRVRIGLQKKPPAARNRELRRRGLQIEGTATELASQAAARASTSEPNETPPSEMPPPPKENGP